MTRKRTLSGEGKYARIVPKNYNKDDPHLSWFYQPHTISMLILSGIILVYVAFNSEFYVNDTTDQIFL